MIKDRKNNKKKKKFNMQFFLIMCVVWLIYGFLDKIFKQSLVFNIIYILIVTGIVSLWEKLDPKE